METLDQLGKLEETGTKPLRGKVDRPQPSREVVAEVTRILEIAAKPLGETTREEEKFMEDSCVSFGNAEVKQRGDKTYFKLG